MVTFPRWEGRCGAGTRAPAQAAHSAARDHQAVPVDEGQKWGLTAHT